MSLGTEAKKNLVPAQTLKGYRDILPEEMIFQNALVDRIRTVLEKYGFMPLDTPCVEYLTTLSGTGGEETEKDIVRFKSKEGESVGLRFDLTVPFARLLAQHPEELRLPFRRYQLAPVFRNDKPGEGRYRQFRQFDFDAAGSHSVAVDAEIVAVMHEIMRVVGFGGDAKARDFEIRVNHRRLLAVMLDACKIHGADEQKRVLRVVDKLQKIGDANVRKELGAGRVDDSGDTIKGVGLSGPTIDQLMSLIKIQGNSRKDVLDQLLTALPEASQYDPVFGEMRELDTYLASLGIPEMDVVFYPSLARGLEYYTGPIFEAYILAAPDIGAVIAGGRYDNLVDRFMETSIPATGASFGLDRFTAALRRLGRFGTTASLTKVLILSMPGVPTDHLLRIATSLRSESIPTEVLFQDTKAKLSDQLSLANSRQVSVALIVGIDEYQNGTISVKDLRAGLAARSNLDDREAFRKASKSGQITVPLADLVSSVKVVLV
jgi:histidyl-tRNA synthetase